MKVEIKYNEYKLTLKSDEIDADILQHKDVLKYAGMLVGTVENLKSIKKMNEKIKKLEGK